MQPLEIVVVWAPRPAHPKWRDYRGLLELHRAATEHVGHRHVVVCEQEGLEGFDCKLVGPLPESLMHAILAGQLAYLRQWSGEHPVVLADADCFPCQALDRVFDGSFEIGLTSRPANEVAPIQNGAMYFARGGKEAAVKLFERALGLCKDHWGGDQEAIAAAVAPVPHHHGVYPDERLGARIAFFSTETHNHSSKGEVRKLRDYRFMQHFKGDTKHLAEPFVRQVLGARCKALA